MDPKLTEEFAMRVGLKDEFAHVGIPTIVYAGVNKFYRTLKQRILRAAVRQAALRGPDDQGHTRIKTKDILQSAPLILPELESELKRILLEVENSHGQNAA
jgi:hypothetical protein